MALNREGEYPNVSAMEKVIPQRALIIMTRLNFVSSVLTLYNCKYFLVLFMPYELLNILLLKLVKCTFLCTCMYVCFFFLHQRKIAAPILHSITHIRQNIIINSIESMGRNKFQWDEKRKDPIKKLAKM